MEGYRASIVAERRLVFEPFSVPDDPGEGQILLETQRTIISAGTELANFTGLEPLTRVPGSWCYYPWRPGYGGIGRVLRVGSGVDRFREGDLVYGIYPHATHVVEDTRSRVAVRVPEEMDLTRAVFTRMAGVAITGYRRAETTLGDVVLIIGLGLVGNLCGQFFALEGRMVIGLDPVAHRRELAEKCGFTATFDSGEEGLREKIAEVTGGRGARVAIDAVGHSALVDQAIELVNNWGQVILLGSPRASHVADMTPALSRVHLRGIDVKGALEWIYPLLWRPDMGNAVTVQGNAEIILDLITKNRLIIDPLLSHEIAPRQLDEAYHGLLERKEEYLGVVLDWTRR